MARWTEAQMRIRAGWLLDSYRHWSGTDLIELPDADDDARARALFEAPLAVLAHDAQPDPVCIYANAAALKAFELTLEQAAGFRTRETVENDGRADRTAALSRASVEGLVTDYSGVRVTASGRRFRLLDGRIWTLLSEDGVPVGQAAAFRPGEL